MTPATVDIVRGYRPIDRLIPRHWQRGDLTANGIAQRYYRTGGRKPPLVLLHGILEGALAWLRAACALEREFDVVMLDARGHGHSARLVDDDFTPATLAADVSGALEALRLDAVNLVGFSLGATTAAFVADRDPRLVARLVLAGLPQDTGPVADRIRSPGYQAWVGAYNAWLVALKTQTHAERMAAGVSQLPPGAPIPPEEDYVAWVENSANLDLTLARMSSTLWAQHASTVKALYAALERIACPTLVIKSAFTIRSDGPLAIVEEPSSRQQVRIVRFENTGHLVHRDRFDDLHAEIRSFLQRP